MKLLFLGSHFSPSGQFLLEKDPSKDYLSELVVGSEVPSGEELKTKNERSLIDLHFHRSIDESLTLVRKNYLLMICKFSALLSR